MTLELSILQDDLQTAIRVLEGGKDLQSRCMASDVIIGTLVSLSLADWMVANIALVRRSQVEKVLSLAMKGLNLLALQNDAMQKEFSRPEETIQLAKKRLQQLCLVCEIHPTVPS